MQDGVKVALPVLVAPAGGVAGVGVWFSESPWREVQANACRMVSKSLSPPWSCLQGEGRGVLKTQACCVCAAQGPDGQGARKSICRQAPT